MLNYRIGIAPVANIHITHHAGTTLWYSLFNINLQTAKHCWPVQGSSPRESSSTCLRLCFLFITLCHSSAPFLLPHPVVNWLGNRFNMAKFPILYVYRTRPIQTVLQLRERTENRNYQVSSEEERGEMRRLTALITHWLHWRTYGMLCFHLQSV